MNKLLKIFLLAVGTCLTLNPSPVWAFAHLWQVKEVFTNHDGTVQFIELFDSFNGENLTNNTVLRATSDGVLKTLTLMGNVSTSSTTAGRHMLFATPGFAALTGGISPNYTLPNPTTFGPFFNPNANSITISYSASNDSITFAGSLLPKDGVNSLTDANASGFPGNPINLSSGVNSPTNFAGNAGSVNVPPPDPPMPTGDYNNNGFVDAADYVVWRETFGQEVENDGDGADGDADGMVDQGDYDFWAERFGSEIPLGSGSVSGVPEPATVALLFAVLLSSGRIRRRSR